MTSKLPLLLVLVEMEGQLKEKSIDLGLGLIPRALTNSRFDEFDPALRIHVDVSKIPWLRLPRMTAVSENIHKRVTAMREQRKKKEKLMSNDGNQASRTPRLTPGERLRERDPW